MKNLLPASALLIALSMSTGAFAMEVEAPPHSYFEQTLAKLPPKDASQIRNSVKQAYEQNKPTYEQVRKGQDDLHDLIVAPTFDKTAYLAKKADLAKMYDQMRLNVDTAFAGAIASLPQDERKLLANSMPGHGHRKSDDKAQQSATSDGADKQ